MSDEPAGGEEQPAPHQAGGDAKDSSGGNGGGSPAFLSGAKGWITGLTSLAVAATAMAAAFGNLFGTKPDATPQAAVSTTAPAPQAAAAATAEEADLPTVYKGDKLHIEWNGKTWEMTSADGHFTYEEMLSPDDYMVLAYDKSETEYLRWPIEGGVVEYSADDRASWITYGEVAVVK